MKKDSKRLCVIDKQYENVMQNNESRITLEGE